MRYLIVFLILAGFPFVTSAYSLITKKVEGYQVKIFHIPKNDGYKVVAVPSNTGTTLEFLVKSVGGIAGINGAYFSPYDYSGLPDNTSTIRIAHGNGFTFSRYFPDTGINGIFGFLSDNSPILVQNNIYGEKLLRENYNSGMILEIQSGIANFPILLVDSVNLVPKYSAVGLITDKMKSKTNKSFICRTEQDDIKMGVVEKISLLDISEFIKIFGCVDAINLDNGGSLGIYNKGKYIFRPGRNIMDAFVIVKK